MIFFVGLHQPSDAGKVRAACISAHRIQNRKSAFPGRRILLDSGAFRTIELYGGYPEPVENYATLIRRTKIKLGHRLLAAVAQDYMCEPFMLKRTGLTVAEHQRLTIERYDDLLKCDTGGTRVLPVLQGYSPASYVEHVRQYGARLKPRAWVGVGSVCRRNRHPLEVLEVLAAIKAERPDLRLHGFGVKLTALAHTGVSKMLFSADSMAWSFNARKNGRDPNSPAEAKAFAEEVTSRLRRRRGYQTSLFQD